jgi:alkylation response protein AidB-like acyl-CoA dehydrogenase
MPTEMTETHDSSLAGELFTESRRLLEAAGSPERWLRDDVGEALDESWRAIARAGWFRTLVPEDDDGLGLGLFELGAVFRAVGHRPMRGPLLDQAVTVPLLLRVAHGAARDRLTACLDGEAVAVLAEDPAAPYGRGPDAVRFADGTLDGEAALVPFASEADHLVVVASSSEGPALVLVDAAAAEVTPTTSADPCVDYGVVRLRDVAVGPDSVIAVGPEAAELRDLIRGGLRLMAVAELSGAAEELTDLAVEYAKIRNQFGRPIGGFQAVRHLLAEMSGRTSALRNLADAVLADASDESRWAELGRAAKAYSAEPARFVAEQSLQVHGGIGFTWETRPHLHLRRVLTLEGYLGEAADLLTEIGEEETR